MKDMRIGNQLVYVFLNYCCQAVSDICLSLCKYKKSSSKEIEKRRESEMKQNAEQTLEVGGIVNSL
jgi:hypothetical protein